MNFKKIKHKKKGKIHQFWVLNNKFKVFKVVFLSKQKE
jgi:hypothetical protein